MRISDHEAEREGAGSSRIARSQMMRARAAAAIAWAAVVVLIALFGVAGAAADTVQDLAIHFRMNPVDGQIAPAFTLPTLAGLRFSLADFKGQVVLLYFWATW
jgi:cytochrome oxidase Cu insertion factor (SCO1/SenC/PrrC family)